MYALSNIKHNGNQYFRGDHIPELTEEQARRLVMLGVASYVVPADTADDTGSTRVLSDEERRANRKKTEKAEVVEEKKGAKKAEKKAEKKDAKKAEKHANPDAL